MTFLGVIPARYGSTRFEGKPLKAIAGKPLLQWVIEGSRQSKKISKLLVATDDARIAALAKQCGVQAVMTDSNLPSGSDRVWAAIQNISGDIVINIQGDEPLITGAVLDDLAGAFNQPDVEMATLARNFKINAEVQNPHTAKIVLDRNDHAIYFSRLPIPHTRVAHLDIGFACVKHIGLYGYRREFLQRFCSQPPTTLELCEGLEQLRALWMGAKIKVIRTNYESWGVDTPEDVIRVEKLIKERETRS